MVQFQRSVKIHTTSKPNKPIVKQIRFDELYVTMVSDRSYDQRFKKSTFGQLPNLSQHDVRKKLSKYLGYYIPGSHLLVTAWNG